MAYIVDDENKKKDEESASGSQGQILSSPGAAPIGGNGQAATSTADKPTASGSFTNLKAYIGANEGNDAAMGKAVGGMIGGHGEKASTAGAALQDTGKSAIQSGTVTDTTGATNTIRGTPATATATAPTATPEPARVDDTGSYSNILSYLDSTTQPAAPVATPVIAAPSGRGGKGGYQAPTESKEVRTSYTLDPNAPSKDPVRRPVAATSAPVSPFASVGADQFNALYNATYSGPSEDQLVDLDGYGDTQAAYDHVSDLGRMASGAGANMNSRGQLLNETYAKDGQQYRGGERTLDSFILGAGEQGLAEMNRAGEQYGNYGDNFQNILGILGGDIADARTTTDKTREDFRGAVDEQVGTLTDRLSGARLDASAANSVYNSTYAKLLKGDPADWNKLDLTQFAPEGSNFSNAQILSYLKDSGVDLSTLLNRSDTRKTLADFADDTDELGFKQLLSLIEGAGGSAVNPFQEADFRAGGPMSTTLNIKGAQSAVTSYLDHLAQQKAAQKAAAAAAAQAEKDKKLTESSAELEALMASLGVGHPSLGYKPLPAAPSVINPDYHDPLAIPTLPTDAPLARVHTDEDDR